MPDGSLTLGRVSLNGWAVKPSLHHVSLGGSVYSDGITAGVEVSVLWAGGYLVWSWNHANCGCLVLDDE